MDPALLVEIGQAFGGLDDGRWAKGAIESKFRWMICLMLGAGNNSIAR